jgi:hypothetical protein
MIKRYVLVVFSILSFFSLGFAVTEQVSVSFLEHTYSQDRHFFIFELENYGQTSGEYVLRFDARNLNGTQQFSCTEPISLTQNTLSKKVWCETSEILTGSLLLTTTLETDSELISTVYTSFSFYNNIEQRTQFFIEDGKTRVEISLDGVGEHVQVRQIIPKQVIERLNKNNRDLYIESALPYIIVEEDPIIAWNIEKLPAKINYTIKKEVSSQSQTEFSVEITQSSSFIGFKIFALLLILGLLVLLFKPSTKKK